MHTLTRTVRFTLSTDATGPGANGYGGRPAIHGLGRYYEFDVRCEGEPETRTGYLINIKDIDHAVRAVIVPRIDAAGERADPVGLMPALLRAAREALPVPVRAVAWRLTPHLELEASMTEQKVLIRQRFEFSASHRLHVTSLSDEENRRIFGKCNNPAGHGHNYRVEPCIAADPGSAPSFAELESIVDRHVIEVLDHKHLNDQVPAFHPDGGLNPSVENIARVCHDLLAEPIAQTGCELHSVTVWETDRTSATYPG